MNFLILLNNIWHWIEQQKDTGGLNKHLLNMRIVINPFYGSIKQY